MRRFGNGDDEGNVNVQRPATARATAVATATGISICSLLVHSCRMHWDFPIEMSAEEEQFCRTLGTRSRFYCFLRRARHVVFDAAFQAQLATMYEQRPSGNRPVPPAMLAMAVILQAYTGASDAEAIECIKADQRWQLPLDCMGSKQPAFCQKTLAFFRKRLVETGMDQQLLARTVHLAKDTGLFDSKKLGKLRVAIDSAPLQGAGRVEDTINLIGHAIRNLVKAIVQAAGCTQKQIVKGAGLTVVGAGSVKARLDIDWNDKEAQKQALRRLMQEAQRLQSWLEQQCEELAGDDEVQAAQQMLRRVIDQDTEPDPDGSGPRIKQGVAPDRVISISDPDMRHGRKSSSRTINGYKRYQTADIKSGVVLAACSLPANVAELYGADKMRAEMQQHGTVVELNIDRAFLASELARDTHALGHKILAKPFHTPNGMLFTKQQFEIDLESAQVVCPAGKVAEIQGQSAKFSSDDCTRCSQRNKCQKPGVEAGRIITIHPQEDLMQELQAKLETASGRKVLRKRVMIEHNLAHHCNRQGPRARYRGTRKNDFDARRMAIVHNLMVIKRHSDDGQRLDAMAA